MDEIVSLMGVRTPQFLLKIVMGKMISNNFKLASKYIVNCTTENPEPTYASSHSHPKSKYSLPVSKEFFVKSLTGALPRVWPFGVRVGDPVARTDTRSYL